MNVATNPTISLKRKEKIIRLRSASLKSSFVSIFTIALILMACGLLALFSASSATLATLGKSPYSIFLKQLGFASAGIILALLIIYLILPYVSDKVLGGLINAGFFVSLIATALSFVPGFSIEANNSKRWVSVLGVSFQPSEFLKVALILFLASVLLRLTARGAISYFKDDKGKLVVSFKEQLPTLKLYLAVLLSLALVIMQPHLGMTAIIFASSVVTLILIGVPAKTLLKAGLTILILVGAILVAKPDIYERAMPRLRAFVNPQSEITGESFQLMQSISAISSGGLFGKGYMQSYQKIHRLPLAEKDFIFAIWAEEMGLVGAVFIIALFMVLLWNCLRASLLLPFGFESVSISALSFLIVMQALVNIGSNVGLLPVSGLTLPFFSYGGSSLLSTWIAVGLILGLIRRAIILGEKANGGGSG